MHSPTFRAAAVLLMVFGIACISRVSALQSVAADGEAHTGSTGRLLLDKKNVVRRGNTRRLVVFGDSISDNGVLWRRLGKTIPVSPPYKNGRYSNGPVIPEYLAEKLGLDLLDFAEGGATACEAFKRPDFSATRNVETQVSRAVSSPPTGLKSWKNTAAALLAGQNDLFTLVASQSTATPLKVQDFAPAVAGCIASSAEKLLKAGVKKLIVSKVGPVHFVPRLQPLGNAAVQLVTAAEGFINAAIDSQIGALKLKYPDAKIQVVDIYGVFTDIKTNPAKYGLKDVTTACLRCTKPQAAGEATCVPVNGQSFLVNDCTAAAAKKRLWWDTLHFTTVVHKVLANTYFSQLTAVGALFGKPK